MSQLTGMVPPEVLDATRQRYEQHATEREQTKQLIAAGKPLQTEAPEQNQLRGRRLLHNPAVRERLGLGPVLSASIETPEEISPNTLERVIGAHNILGVVFLDLGAQAARTVGRVHIITPGGDRGFGTGFLVAPRLLLTNNHVLPDVATARGSFVEFNYQNGVDGAPQSSSVFQLQPDEFFLTDSDPKGLDFTLVAVAPISREPQVPLSRFGYNPLSAAKGKINKGECINIIQHPNGEPKQLALQENKLVDRLDRFLHYETDTMPGSSGSPLYNNQWEIVGLHHSGVPAMKDGKILAVDGSLWNPEMGEQAIKWIANEGARISQILAFLEGKREGLPTAQRVLLDEMLEAARNDEMSPATPVAPDGTSSSSSLSPPSQGEQPCPECQQKMRQADEGRYVGSATTPHTESPEITLAGNGSVSITLPLRISVQLGAARPAAAMAPPGEEGPAILRDTLAAARRAEARPYFDAAKNQTDRDAYYRDIDLQSLSPSELYDALSPLLRRTHLRAPHYAPSSHLYPWVDRQPDLSIRSIYTQEVFATAARVEEFIREEFRKEETLQQQTEALLRRESFSALELTQEISALEAQLGFNCEHVVPQSWFNKREPMRGDLHHLFACESRCNSFRGNTPYWDFPDFQEAVRQGCGRSETDRFEPAHGRGAAARATLYFLLRHPGEINDTSRELQRERLDILINWSEAEPVSPYEQHRNQAIFEAQGNRNPLIDFPELARRIDFARGLG